VFPVKYELGFYITEDAILHSHRRNDVKSYMFHMNVLGENEEILEILQLCSLMSGVRFELGTS
jgi:hypothetical protein